MRWTSTTPLVIVGLLLVAMSVSAFANERTGQGSSPAPADLGHKLVLAHYMPGFALNLHYNRYINPYAHHARGAKTGGQMREAPLLAACWFKKTPPWAINLHAWAHHEIRLAVKAGIDGFVFDYGASRRTAPNGLHEFIAEGIIGAFFDVAEKDFPNFKLTLSLDQATIHHRQRRLLTIEQFLKRYGNSPNMLRINGKIAFTSYRASALPPYAGGPKYAKMTARQVIDNQRQVIANWRWIWSHVHQPVAFIADMPAAWMYKGYWKVDDATAAKVFDLWADAFAGLSVFGPLDTPKQARHYYTMMDRACRAHGKLFMPGVYWGWRRSFPNKRRIFMHGSDFLRSSWALARQLNVPAVQIITWNDYSEESDIAPSINHGYALWQLDRFFGRWFKQGKMPVIHQDRIFLFYRRYPDQIKASAFPATADPWYPLDNQLEVLTILKAPAELVVGQGKNITRVPVPAGLHSQRFALPLGKPVATIYRAGKQLAQARGLVPVTHHPYRAYLGTYCISSQFKKWFRWDAGFPFNPSDKRWTDVDHNGVADWLQLIDDSPDAKVHPK